MAQEKLHRVDKTTHTVPYGKGDINLPDEKKGKPVGTMNRGGIGHTVMGGDPDDPRWKEHNERKRAMFYGTLGGAKYGVTSQEAKAKPVEAAKKKRAKATDTDVLGQFKKAAEGYGTLRALIDGMKKKGK